MKYIYATLLVFIALSGSLYAKENQQTVAIVDFKLDSKSHQGFDWLGKAMSDLLNVKLAQSGVQLLDRDSIAFVLREQKLDATYQSASMMGAHKLIHGSLLIDKSGEFTLIAQLTATSQSEIIGSHQVKGLYPKDFESSIKEVVVNLLPSISDQLQPVASKTMVHPEALAYFYRGVNYCSEGYPELGWFCFRTAYKLDTKLLMSKVWEMRAYQMMGFEGHAHIIQKQLISLKLKATDIQRFQKKKDKILAVIPPVIHSNSPQSNETLLQLKNLSQKAVIANQIRLFDVEGFDSAIDEFDHHLKNFDLHQTPLYQHWLMANTLLFTNVYPQEKGDYKIVYVLVNTLNGEIIQKVTMKAKLTETAKISSTLDLLLKSFKQSKNLQVSASKSEQIHLSKKDSSKYKVFTYTSSSETPYECAYLNRLRNNEQDHEARLYLLRNFTARIDHGPGRANDPFMRQHATLELEKFLQLLPGDTSSSHDAFWIYAVYQEVTDLKYVYMKKYGLPIFHGSIRKQWDKNIDATIKKHPNHLISAGLNFLKGTVYWYENNQHKQCIESLLNSIKILNKLDAEVKNESFYFRLLYAHYMIAKKYKVIQKDDLAILHFRLAKLNLDRARSFNIARDQKHIGALAYHFSIYYNDQLKGFRLKANMGSDRKYDVESDIINAVNGGVKHSKITMIQLLKELTKLGVKMNVKQRGKVSVQLQEKARAAIELLTQYLNDEPELAQKMYIGKTLLVMRNYKNFTYSLMFLIPNKKNNLLTQEEFGILFNNLYKAMENNLNHSKVKKDSFDEYKRHELLASLYFTINDPKGAAKVFDTYLNNCNSAELSNLALLNLIPTYQSNFGCDLKSNLQRLGNLKAKFAVDQINWRVYFQLGFDCMVKNQDAMAFKFFKLIVNEKSNGLVQKSVQQSATYYMAKSLIKQRKWPQAATLLKAIIKETGGQKWKLNTSYNSSYHKSYKEQQTPLDIKAKKLLEILRSKLPTE
jgi:hypothetical protein